MNMLRKIGLLTAVGALVVAYNPGIGFAENINHTPAPSAGHSAGSMSPASNTSAPVGGGASTGGTGSPANPKPESSANQGAKPSKAPETHADTGKPAGSATSSHGAGTTPSSQPGAPAVGNTKPGDTKPDGKDKPAGTADQDKKAKAGDKAGKAATGADKTKKCQKMGDDGRCLDPDPSKPKVTGQNRAPDSTTTVDDIKVPNNAIPVINPNWLIISEKPAVIAALKGADNTVKDVEIEDGTGKVTVTYNTGNPKTTSMAKLVQAGFITYKAHKDDTTGKAAPELPDFYNSGRYCATDNPRYEAGSVALFRDDYEGKAKVSMKLENHPGMNRNDVVVYANNVGQLKLAGNHPEVELKDDGAAVTDRGGLGGFKIRGYQIDRPEPVNQRLITLNVNKVPAETEQPYKFYTLITKSVANDRIARDARLGKHEVTYTVKRKSGSDTRTGVVNIRVLPLKEKFEPVVTNNSATNPLDLGKLEDELNYDKVASAIGFDVVDGANSVRDKEPECPLGGPEPSCYKLAPSKRLDLLQNYSSFRLRGADDKQTRENLANTKFVVDSDITATEPNLPSGVHKIRVKAIYPDNQTAPEYAKYNPDGDSVDYFEIYVKATQYETHKPNLTVVPLNHTLDDVDKKRVSEAIRRANPGRGLTDDRITFDNDGNATVTFPNGNTEKFGKDDLVKPLNAPELTKVANRHNLTTQEKIAVSSKVWGAGTGDNANSKLIGGQESSNVKVLPNGEVEVKIAGRDKPASFLPNQTVIQVPELTRVADKSNLEDSENKAVAEAIIKANGHLFKSLQGEPTDGSDGAKIYTTDNGAKITVKKDGSVSVVVKNPMKPSETLPEVEFTQAETVFKFVPPELTPVKDRNNLSKKEKDAVEAAIKKSNENNNDLTTTGGTPDTIEVGSDGRTTVTLKNRTPNRDFELPPAETVIQLPQLTKVKDPNNLTEDDQRAVVNKIKKANPHLGLTDSPIKGDPTAGNDGSRTYTLENGSTIKVGKDGETTVEVASGSVANLTQKQTVKFKKTQTVVKLNPPLLTEVVDQGNLTDGEQDKVEKAIKDANPNDNKKNDDKITGVYPKTDGETIVVLGDGRRVIYDPDETVIEKPQLTPVKDPSSLTPGEIDKVLEKVKLTNPNLGDKVKKTEIGTDGKTKTVTLENGITIKVEPNGKATVTIPTDKPNNPQVITFNNPDTVVKLPELTVVKDPSKLTPEDQGKVAKKIIEANPDVFGNNANPGKPDFDEDNGTATYTLPNGSKIVVKKDGETEITKPNGRTAIFTKEQTVREENHSSGGDSNGDSDQGNHDGGNSGGGNGGSWSSGGGTGGSFGGGWYSGGGSGSSFGGGTSGSSEPEAKPSQPSPKPSEGPKPSPQPQQPQQPQQTPVKDPELTPVKNPQNLTPAEKQQVREAVKRANPNLHLSDDKIVVENDGWVTVFLPDGSTVRIPPVKGVSEMAPGQPGNPALNGKRSQLPRTGSPVLPVLGVALILVAAGAFLTLRSRKRSRS